VNKSEEIAAVPDHADADTVRFLRRARRRIKEIETTVAFLVIEVAVHVAEGCPVSSLANMRWRKRSMT
jgi:hypothetical protein